MTDMVSSVTDWPIEILVGLRREELLSQGRHDAFVFALECKGNVSCLCVRIHDTEETIANPPEHLKGPMKPNASPRVYKDGYLAGLKDALRIVEQAGGSAARTAALAPARAPALAIAEERSQYDVTAEPAPAAPSEPSPPTTSPTTDD